MGRIRMGHLLRRSATLCTLLGLLGGSTVCFGGDPWCASARFTIAAAESEPGNSIGKRFVQTFEVATDLAPSEQSKSNHLEVVNVTLEVMIVRTWENVTGRKDEEETIKLRVKRVGFGHFETRIKQDFHETTVGIKRIYTRNITCDNSNY